MIDVYALSDKAVREKVIERVGSADRPLIVSQIRTDRFMRPVPERQPFATIERRFGGKVDQLVVADAGSVEGMWRDPVGELADRLYPDDRARAYAAASGYLLLQRGRPLAIVKKRGPDADAWFLQEALHRSGLGIPAPDPAEKPGARRAAAPDPADGRSAEARSRDARSAEPRRGGPGRRERDTPPPAPAAPPPSQSPWEVLGIPPGASREEARKAFRALVALYHPDKVAHLAPEFQQLAEQRTRELLAAWAELEDALG